MIKMLVRLMLFLEAVILDIVVILLRTAMMVLLALLMLVILRLENARMFLFLVMMVLLVRWILVMLELDANTHNSLAVIRIFAL
jgi:hypothetical protein